jgi:hypothetical protein
MHNLTVDQKLDNQTILNGMQKGIIALHESVSILQLPADSLTAYANLINSYANLLNTTQDY